MTPSVRTSPRARVGWRGWLFGLGLALAAGPAAAAIDYCVGSVEELSTALTVATSTTGQTIMIKLKQGTYHVGGSFLMNWHEYNAMRWLGGYNVDCSNRSVRPANTIIDGDGGHMAGLRMHGDLRIEGLRFQNMSGNGGTVFVDTWTAPKTRTSTSSATNSSASAFSPPATTATASTCSSSTTS